MTALRPTRSLDRLFNPRTVALVGASERSYLAGNVWASMQDIGFDGTCFPVNPTRTVVFGVRCYPSLSALPGPIDLCLIAVSERGALAVLRESVTAGVPAAVLFTLYNSSRESARQRAEVAAFLADAPIAVCGSGTYGLAVPHQKFAAVMGARPPQRPGEIALVCQSGGILNSISGCLDSVGIGVSAAIATGGEDQLGAAAYIDHLVKQGGTRAIGCVLEQIKDAAAFRLACEAAAANGIAIAVLLVGRSERGKEAAFAHSGSMATDTRILDGLLEQVGAIAVTNLTEMVGVLAVLAMRGSRPLGPRAAIVTISGGETGLAADLAERYGIELPQLAPSTDAALRDIFKTPDLGFGNPVDAAAGSLVVLSDASSYGRCIDAVSADDAVDFVLARHLERPGAEAALERFDARSRKPVFLYSRTAYDAFNAKARPTPGSFVMPDIEIALATLGKLCHHFTDRRRQAARQGGQPAAAAPVEAPSAASGVLMEHEVFPLLRSVGIVVPPVRIIRRGDSVEPALAGLKGPFVIKIVSSSIIHRRSVGGVMLDLDTPAAVSRAAAELFAKFGDRADAVLVEPLLKPDLELMLGAKRSRNVGLAIMLGFGGTFVEDLGTLALRLSPLGKWEASSLVERSGVAAALARLAGARAPLAIELLIAAIMGFDALCRGLGADLVEFDINPLGFQADTLEVCALDAKIVLTRPGGSVS